MEAMLFSQRLKRILAGDPEEVTLPDGAKLHIQNLQNEYFDSVLRDFETIYATRLWSSLSRKEVEIIMEIKRDIRDVIRESENAIDTFSVNSIQNINESSLQQLFPALQGLETKFSDIKLEILQLEASQSYQTVMSNSTSIQGLVSNSRSSSRIILERQIINKKPRMVGREDDMERLLDFLIEGQPSLSKILIVGDSGYGKTTLAAQVYDNIYVKNYFDSRVWVKMPFEFDLKPLLEAILKSLMPSSGLQEIMEKEDEMKITTLRDYLRNKRYLIVLPSLWRPSLLDGVLPDDGNGSRVLATTLSSVWYGDWSHIFSLRPLNDTESLEMLTDGDFSNESSLLESETLKRSLKHICQGRPSDITHLRGMLSRKDKQDALPMLEYLCTRKDISYYYDTVPDYLKPCFVYFAVFPHEYDISTRQLYQLWIAEGFIEENSETTADMYLEELTMRDFIHVTSRSSTGRIKTCHLHGTWVKHAVMKAEFEWFISTWYSELGALVFNQYPLGIENFVLLRYLKLNIPSVTSIPSSLCNLLNLYTLDMPSSHISEAPFDIWKMHKLRHLNFASIKLPAPPGIYCYSLENLNFISALCSSSCTEDLLARLPNLQTLKIYGDLGSHQSMLSKSLAICLESLKLVNESKTTGSPSIVLSEYQFPPTLTQLSLSNTELKDDPLPILEKLPNLEVLKLKRNSYKGRKLASRSGGFPQLRILHLKSLLWLEEWIMESGAMKKLKCLLINPCAYLKRLPEELWHIKTFNQMELWLPQPELKPKLREVEDMERYDIQIYPYGI
ncbi:hypothetical protein EZV62_009092 [Acer yangbiense]|uniref:Uncharacterized protein n=1 Tax=Acer yangbiense TaxID=1000413 RepID=A0A5C7IEP7_9ROSI|nr:hypothetical protein EZV62_009092 [Acer yangbiense]